MTVRSFNAETGKILQLMIHSLYANKDIFLRELVSNASDACDKLRYESLTNPELLGTEPLSIAIALDTEGKTISITDTGIGMNEEELIANLGTIARSGTQEFTQKLTGDTAQDMTLIGQFGVGFYSAFMVADQVEVFTRKVGTEQGYRWSSEGMGEYAIEPSEQAPAHGTRVLLHIRTDAAEYLDKFKLSHIIETYSDHVGFPITLTRDAEAAETVNRASALWTRGKSDIAPEQYQEFYRHVSHLPDEPWLTLHTKAEGKLEYTALLFIPSMKPFDLFHPDRKRSVKLYVRRVFITEDGELVPHYLRFLKGVVDSQDLPLNISRETLQHNPMLARMSDALVKRLLTELGKRATADLADYSTFWKNFGAVLKEGLCEANAPKELLLDASCFNSTLHAGGPDDLTRLDAYVSRMKEGQEHVYYLIADSLDAARLNPQLEGFRERGIEVLLMSDHVDDFWVNVVGEYKGKKFKSVTRAGADLEAMAPTEQKPESTPEQTQETDALVLALKEILGAEVRDVRITHKLAESPVCLAVEEGDMDIRFEQFLRSQKQYPGRSAKILEINPQHPIIRALAVKLSDGALPDDAKDAAFLLLDQARLVEGEEIANPSEFSRRISLMMVRSLAA